MRRWHEAQAGSVRCRSIRCRSVPPMSQSLPSLSASTPEGGGGGGVPRMFSRIHLPRLTGEVRVGLDVDARTLAWVSTPPRDVPASDTRRKPSPDNPGDAIMPRQAFVDERVIRAEEFQHAAVLVVDRFEEELCLRRALPIGAIRRIQGRGRDRVRTPVSLRVWSHWLAKFSARATRRVDRGASA